MGSATTHTHLQQRPSHDVLELSRLLPLLTQAVRQLVQRCYIHQLWGARLGLLQHAARILDIQYPATLPGRELLLHDLRRGGRRRAR